jgi:phenylalanyl-tRNA synthetase alpha chain
MVELREHEQKTLLALRELNGRARVEQIAQKSSLDQAAIMRAALVLSKKRLVKIHTQKQTVISLNKEGQVYARQGLPERGTFEVAFNRGGEIPISDVLREVDMPSGAIPVAMNWLVQKHWARIDGERSTIVVTQKEEPPLGDDEELLRVLDEKGTLIVEELGKNLQQTALVLKRRKLVKTKERTLQKLELTRKGTNLVRGRFVIAPQVSQLTPDLIITGKWREAKLRKFDVTAAGPEYYPAKAHPLQQVIQKAREIFLEMGFTEIRGPLVETAFWNFDALFQPQDHPAREMMDTFYLANPKAGALPRKSAVNAVAKTHENGWTTGSKGWGYKWSSEEARRLVLRTHTTAETIKYLSKHKKPPIKVFSVDRVYRNERIDYRHTAEFHQIEGIVVDKGVTLRDLMGTLKTFYARFGLKKVRFWPCYFPYTEPSAEATVYVPKLKTWMELCGMGMFRPEVLAPMGIKYPVLAWGGGLERVAMLELGIDDIRLPYNNSLSWIRRTPLCRQ